MRVLHISTALSWRGGEQQIAYLYEELEKLGVEQIILCARRSAMAAYCEGQGLNYQVARKRGSISLAYMHHIRRLARSVDLIHIHDSHAHNNAVLAVSTGAVNKPMVLHRRVDFPVSNSPFSRYKYNHPAIKKIICVSNAIKEIMAPAIQQQEKLATVYSGVDLDRSFVNDGRLRQEYSIHIDTKLIGNVAALAPHKDYFTFLRTAAEFKGREGVHFFIIGEGHLSQEIEAEIGRLGLNDQVTMTGFRDDMEQVLPELDVMLVTSETEGLGTSILDAFLAKVPVVATRAGGIPELIIDGETGLLAPVKDHNELARQVQRLLDDNDLKSRIINQAEDRVAAFSKQNMASAVLHVYKEVLA